MILIAAFVLYVALLALICLYALRWGGATERRAALALIVAVVATQCADALGSKWVKPEYGIMVVDAALLVAFIAIAHRSDRFWPIWIAAAQLIGVITHLAVVLHPQVGGDLYRMMQPFWVFPILAGIAWGTWSRARSA